MIGVRFAQHLVESTTTLYTRVHGYTLVFIRIFKSRAVARLILLQRRNITHRIFVRRRERASSNLTSAIVIV